MRTKSVIGLLIGLAALGALFVWQGLETVVALLAEAGWSLLLICLFSPVDQMFGAEAWRRLFPPARRPRFWRTFLASAMGSAVNTLLPVATIGGEVAKARVLTLWSHAGNDTISTTVVDKTVQALVVLIWGLVGIALLPVVAPGSGVVAGALIGAAILAFGIAGFVAAQLAGSFSFFAGLGGRFAKGKWMQSMSSGAAATDSATRAIYRRPGAIAGAVVIRLAARIAMVGEVLLAAHLMGHPISIIDAVLIKGLVVGLRGVAFAVPGAIGVQEGAFVGIGLLIGLPADLMLAVSLATRVREIAPAIPFLVLWQHVEGRAIWRRWAVAADPRPAAQSGESRPS
jgi:putative membrane protein